MGRLLRRLRGLLGTATVWAGAYALAGLLVGAGFWAAGLGFFAPRGPAWLVVWAEVGAIIGAISGTAFSLAVMVLERRRDFSAITPLRFGSLGAVTAGIVLGLLSAPQWFVFGLVGAALGFLCGSGSVVIARRAFLPPSTMRSIPPA